MIRPTGFGVGIPPQLVWEHGPWIAESVFDLLGPRCFYNWAPVPVHSAPGWTFIPMVWSASTDLDLVRRQLTDYPGATWLLWNEPERPEQANMTPATAANRTRGFLRMAWDTGEEFQWAAPGVWIGPDKHDGLEWATEFAKNMRRSGISRPSYWHIHGYRSTTLAQFDANWKRFEAWYTTWGAGAPVILSEICAEAAPVANQIAIMDRVAGMLRSGELSAAFWFASHTSSSGTWQNAELCDVDTRAQTVKLKPLGEHFVGLGL